MTTYYPPEYDRELDPDQRLLELEIEVDRLRAERNYYGRHKHVCRTRDKEGCECGWVQARLDTLWDRSGVETVDLQRALESHWD